MRKGLLCSMIGLLLLTSVARGTTDYGAENPITRQVTELEEPRLYEPLFWRGIGELASEDPQAYAEAKGYNYTEFPYLLECLLAAGLASVLCVVLRLKWGRKQIKA